MPCPESTRVRLAPGPAGRGGGMLLAALLCGCTDPVETGSPHTGDTVEAGACATCLLQDRHNYTYTSKLDVEVVPGQEAEDLEITWQDLTTGIRDAALDPCEDISEAWLVVFQDLEPEEVADGLARDTLSQSEVSIYLTCTPEQATCHLSDFNLMGTYLDIQEYFTEQWGGTWLVVLVDSDGQTPRSMVFLEPSAHSATTQVAITDQTAELTLDADLESLAPVEVVAGEPELTLDWSGITRTGLGNDLDLHRLDRALLACYSEDLEALEASFFSLEELADRSWEAEVTGQEQVILSALEGDTAMAGVESTSGSVTSGSVWLFGLFCSTCTNPAPWFLTELRGG